MSLPITFDQGLNTAKDASQLDPGEMAPCTGVFYKPGDTRAHKIGGTVEFDDSTSGKKIDGVALLQFDEGGTDKVVALSNKVLYGANLTGTGDTGTLSSLKSGLGTLATSLSAAQFNDKHFLALGSENLAVKADGTTHEMGMRTPTGEVTAVPALGTFLIRASADGGTYNNASKAYDSDAFTFSSISLSAVGTSVETFSWTGTSNTNTGRVLNVKYAIGGVDIIPDFPSDNFDDVGGTFSSGFKVSAKFEISENNGTSYTTVLTNTRTQATGFLNVQFDISDTFEIQNKLILRTTFEYLLGDSTGSLLIYDMSVNDGGTESNFTLTTGVYYGVSEWDENESDEGPAKYSKLITMTAGSLNHIIVTLPTKANSRATHWIIYRTTDGGSKPQGLGEIDRKPIAATTYRDTFIDDKDTQTTPLFPLLRTVVQQDVQSLTPLFFPQNSPPPRMVRLRVFEGSLVGLSSDFTRSLFYSMAGRPQSWPEINVIESFPFEDHDQLVDCIALGSVLVIAAQGTMLRLTGLPRVVNSVRDTSRVDQIKGAPGCVGRYALTAYSVSGEPRAAWISPYGVYVTNGDKIHRISENIDWEVFDGIDKSAWVLHWDDKRLCLIMCYSTVAGGNNDRYYLIHMAPEHRKANEQPKWTGPHYGSFNSLASGQVGSTHRLYGGHVSDGSLYTMDIGGADASQAFSGTQVPLIVKTGRIYAGDLDWSALDARLYHGDFGSGQTCTVDWEVDTDDEEDGGFTLTQTVSLNKNKGTQLDISTRCQWAQLTITHTGTGTGSIRDMTVETRDRGRVGAKKVA